MIGSALVESVAGAARGGAADTEALLLPAVSLLQAIRDAVDKV